MRNGKLQLGLIGLGSISQAHVAGYQEEASRAEIAAVCDIREEVLHATSKKLRAKAYRNFEEMLADRNIEAVDIILPHNLHFRVAQAALKSSKHVLVEKPMTPSSQECSQLIALAAEKRLTFTAAENTPFVLAYQAVEELTKSGLVGKPRVVRTFIYGSEVDRLTRTDLWKGKLDGSNGGAIIDAGPHSFYLIKWLFGEIDKLQAAQYKLVNESEVEDNAVISGSLKNGAVFISEFSFTAEIPWGERLEIYGSEGTIILDHLFDPPIQVYRGRHDYEGKAVERIKYNPKKWKSDSIALGVRDFISAVLNERPPRVDPRDAQYGVYIAEKAYESVRSGGRSVNV